MKKVFLGGTCNNSTWREKLISKLDSNRIDYFDPVVDDWTEECMKEEIKQRKNCDYCLYTITPEMIGVYSIAEAVDDSNKRPNKTIFCVLEKENGKSFTQSQIKSLKQVCDMITKNGGKSFDSLESVARFLNTR